MAEHSFYDKKRLCYTEVTDFCDFQGIGNDPMYKRYDSVFSVVDKVIADEYKDFLAQPSYSDEDQIFWFVKGWNEIPSKLSDLEGDSKLHYQAIKDKTLKHYKDVLSSLKGEDRQILAGALHYIHDDFIFCYDDKVVAVAWGMTPDSNQHKVTGAIIKDLQFETRHKVRFDVGENGTLPLKIDAVISRTSGTTLSSIDVPTVSAKSGWKFIGWEPEPIGHRVTRNVTFKALYEELPEEKVIPPIPDHKDVNVIFDSGMNGEILGESSFVLPQGQLFPPHLVPEVSANDGFIFTGWDNSLDQVLDGDVVFTALYERKNVNCHFVSGDEGLIDGASELSIPYGTSLSTENIPVVNAKKGYNFVGWDKSTSSPIYSDTTFNAQYEKIKIPWYVRFRNWLKDFWAKLKENGCLKKLLWLLLLLLLLFLLFSLFRSCHNSGISGHSGDGYVGNPATDVAPIGKIDRGDGSFVDDNGKAHDIVGDDGRLPDEISDHSIVAPITDEDGTPPPIISNPGAPDIISNRLNIYFEDDDVDLNQFASDFKLTYPGADYKIIGADDNVKAVQIQVPEDQRDQVRETINSRMPGYRFFVVDESIFSILERTTLSSSNNGWHLGAINLKAGWSITRGNKDVVVAIVDDGIDATHSMFKDRIYYPYNVFTQNNRLSTGDGHGTHVAGLAVGNDLYYEDGASGVAPNCKLMPVQVFDNDLCTFSSITSGIMYAIHHGADVVNISIGPSFKGLNVLPPSDQLLISETQFKNEEKVFRKIIDIAKKNNVILVFAAGNDDILAKVAPECRTNYTVNVSAVDRSLTVTDFSNYGAGANISAPGKAIYSAFPTNSFASCDGTSMAAPIVSGTIALLKSVNRNLNVTDVLAILQQSGKSVSGNIPPMIQVDRALQLAKTGNFSIPSNDGSSPSNDGTNAPSDTPSGGNSNIGNTPGTGNSNSGNYNDGSSNQTTSPGGNNDSGYAPGSGSQGDSQTDYDAIRRMIEQYKRKISELEQLLPENKK